MWIHVPCQTTRPTSSPSARDTEASNSDSDSPSPLLERYATLNGKSLPARSWLLACRKDSSLKPLSGLTSPPSTLVLGMDLWMSSLRATRASRSASRGSAADLQTKDTCGLSSPGSSQDAPLQSSSSRTSRTTSTSGSEMSETTYSAWVTRLRLDYSRRLKLGLRMFGKGFSSWGTPRAQPSGRGQSKRSGKRRLEDNVAKWLEGYSPSGCIPRDGQKPSGTTARCNLAFIARLMNLPVGWTSPSFGIGRRSFDSWETESSLLLRHMLSACCSEESKDELVKVPWLE